MVMKGAEGPLLMRESEDRQRGERERQSWREGARKVEGERELEKRRKKTDAVDSCPKTIFI